MDSVVADEVRHPPLSAFDSHNTSRNRKKLFFRVLALVAVVVAANWALVWMIMQVAASAPMFGSPP